MAFKMSDKAQILKVFNLRADTNEFIGAGDAYISPHMGLPAHCTDIEPPDVPAGLVAVFDGEKETWHSVEDHRGKTVYDVVTGEPVYISELGALPVNVTAISPGGEYQKWDGQEWVLDKEAETAGLVREATAKKHALMETANGKIATLQDAVDFDMATDEEQNSLVAWRKYRVLLSRIEPEDAPDIVWPEVPGNVA